MAIKGVRKPSRIFKAAGTLALAGMAMVIGTAPAYAVSNVPWSGALCDAAENIQFWNDQGQTSYTVQQGQQIRVDVFYGSGEPVAQGHGTGHSSRWFYWRHTTGAYRVQNCR